MLELSKYSRITVLLIVATALFHGFSELSKIITTDPIENIAEDHYINLTKSQKKWALETYRGAQVIDQRFVVLPNLDNISTEDIQKIKLQTTINLPAYLSDEKVVMPANFIIAHAYKWSINGVEKATHLSHGFNEVVLPITDKENKSREYKITLEMDIKGISQPGLDSRSDIIIGQSTAMTELNSSITRSDAMLSVWAIGNFLILALLACLASLLDRFIYEYMYLALYSVVCALKVSIFFDTFEFIDVDIIDRWTLFNSVDLVGHGTLFAFFSHYFRRDKNIRNWIFLAILSLASANFIFGAVTLETDIYTANIYILSNTILYLIAGYGLFASSRTFFKLRASSLSNVRMYISLTTAVAIILSTAFLISTHANNDFHWIATPTFQLLFNLFMMSMIVIDQSSTRRSKNMIWDKLSVTTDKNILEKIINGTSGDREWVDGVTVMFIDLQGFSRICEENDAQKVYEMLNLYYDIVISEVHKYGGVIDKFIGDGVMAYWGINESLSLNPHGPVLTALNILKIIDQTNANALPDHIPLELGIGIHSGRVCAGIVGNNSRAEYTIIGAPVNIASRLESHTRNINDRILMSSDFVENLDFKNKFNFNNLGAIKLKGHDQLIEAFSLDVALSNINRSAS